MDVARFSFPCFVLLNEIEKVFLVSRILLEVSLNNTPDEKQEKMQLERFCDVSFIYTLY